MGTLIKHQNAAAAGAIPRNPAGRITPAGQRVLWAIALFAGLVLSRWSLSPPTLVSFDEINFAMAVDHFNPAAQQPQPPGDPLFVGLLKVLSVPLPVIETTFRIAVLLLSIAALFFLWGLCEQMAGSGLGVLGPMLLLFNPAFWLSSLINPARLPLAVGTSAVAWCAWLACRRSSTGWLMAAAGALGVAVGFRPALALTLLPLLLWCAWRIRARWTAMALSLLSFAAAVSTWLPSLLIAAGGIRQYLDLLRGYSNEQFTDSSLLFGAHAYEAVRMAWRAVAWSCLGALSWIWLVPVFARRLGREWNTVAIRFLAVWFFPGLLFHATFHVGDPDHTLSIIPALCAAGALVLGSLNRAIPRLQFAAVVSLCVALNVFLFFVPINRTARASGYAAVQELRDYIVPLLQDVRALSGAGPVTAVFAESTVGWRQLSYYEPSVPIIVMSDGPNGAVTIRRITGSQATTEINRSATVTVPSCGTLAWIDGQSRPVANGGGAIRQIRWDVFTSPAAPGRSFDFHGAHLVSSSKPCDGSVPSIVHTRLPMGLPGN